jgi:hypothetical protein
MISVTAYQELVFFLVVCLLIGVTIYGGWSDL